MTDYSEVNCPFCMEDDFDIIGLKSHLENGDCSIYEHTNTLLRNFGRKDKRATPEPSGKELEDALQTIAAENEHEGWEETTPLARAALRRSAPQSGWVAVTERLPDEDREVLVCGDAFGDPAMGRWQEVASWNGTAWISDLWGAPLCFITHWHELPSTPAEEKP